MLNNAFDYSACHVLIPEFLKEEFQKQYSYETYSVNNIYFTGLAVDIFTLYHNKKYERTKTISEKRFAWTDFIEGSFDYMGNRYEAGTELNLDHLEIGQFCHIGGQGFRQLNGKRLKHIGGVKLAKNVTIGSNTCIDKGIWEDTEIHKNVFIDNNVHIAHGVVISSGVEIVAGSVIGGSANIGENTFIGMGVLVAPGVKIGKDCFIKMGTRVTKDIPDGTRFPGKFDHEV
jgi:acetyltransferase-like isoleucine patch superfamily enzyme